MRVFLAKAALVASVAANCPTPPDNGGCCPDCPSNYFCPSNRGCYSNDSQKYCPGGACPAPGPGPGPGPGPTPPPPVQPVLHPCPDGKPRPSKPSGATDLNGVEWPDMCINKTEAHFFGIGDWGGDQRNGHTWENPGKFNQRGGKTPGPDDWGQQYVARQMAGQAAVVEPDFVLNAGDNFYPGGINGQCGRDRGSDPTGQFRDMYSSLYRGKGLDGIPWLSVLGNHDYGGRSFGTGWDDQIFQTWYSPSWVMPAQYFTQRVRYNGFTVETFMLESNFMDALPHGADPNHNICQGGANCWGLNIDTCVHYFQDHWAKSLDMLEEGLKNSTADWRIINTHYPGYGIASQPRIKELHSKYGFDLLFTGHAHIQQIGESNGIPWIVSGGGGGVTSDAKPSNDGHDMAYGFVDFTITKDTLKFDMHTWGGMNNNGSKAIIMASKTLQKKARVGVEYV